MTHVESAGPSQPPQHSERTTPPCCAPLVAERTTDRAPLKMIEPGPRSTRGQLRIPAGTFSMGDAFDEGYPADGETPVHEVSLDAFHLDATTVTNAQFATFVKATGY